MKKALLTLLTCFLINLGFTQNMMPLPAHASVYSSSARGFWFVAPTTFVITGLRVPSEAGSGTQAIQVMKILDPMPIAFTSQSSNFNTLFYTNTGTNGQILSVNILINAGDTIGILGTAGTSNSYGNGYYSSQIFGNTVPIQRFGYQGNINTGATSLIWGVDYQGSGSISRVEVYYDLADISEYPYCVDFEDGESSWVNGGTNDSWEWGEPNNSNISMASSGDNCWVTNLDGDHNNNEVSFVQSPTINLTPLVDPMISFYTIRDLQNGTDGVAFQASADGGSVWATVGNSSSTPPWYNSNSVSSLNAEFSDGNGWTGTNTSWLEMKHSLSAYSNDTALLLRFALASDGATTNEGFGFDDILIAESNDLALKALIYPDSFCGSSATTVRGVVCNNSITYKYGFSLNLDTNGTTISATYPDTLAVCSCDTIDLLTFNTSNGGTWTLNAEVSLSADVNAANDTLSGTMHALPTPTAHISGGGEYCVGDTAQVHINFTGTSPWNVTYFNGSSYVYNGNIATDPFTMILLSGGTLSLSSVTDGSGCPADTSGLTGQVQVTFHPSPEINLGSDSTVCGDYVLDAGSGYSTYAWSTGATTQTSSVTQSGTYGVTATNQYGCEGSDSVYLTVNPLPIIDLPDTVLCEGGSFIFNAGGGFASYHWSDGSTGQQIQVTTTGAWSVTVTDFNGCEGTDQGSITAIVSNPTPNVQSVAGVSPVTLNAGSGFSSYLWNTNETTQTIQVSVTGTYTCTVTDNNGCQGSDDGIAKIWPTGIQDLIVESGFGIYPNPTTGLFIVEFSPQFKKPEYLQIYNASGQLVQRISIQGTSNQIEISLSDQLQSGKYSLVFDSDDGSHGAEIVLLR